MPRNLGQLPAARGDRPVVLKVMTHATVTIVQAFTLDTNPYDSSTLDPIAASFFRSKPLNREKIDEDELVSSSGPAAPLFTPLLLALLRVVWCPIPDGCRRRIDLADGVTRWVVRDAARGLAAKDGPARGLCAGLVHSVRCE